MTRCGPDRGDLDPKGHISAAATLARRANSSIRQVQFVMRRRAERKRKHHGGDRFNQLSYMFQVRHIWIHNFGEADNDFVEKMGTDQSVIGSKIVPSKEEVLSFLDLVEELRIEIRSRLGHLG